MCEPRKQRFSLKRQASFSVNRRFNCAQRNWRSRHQAALQSIPAAKPQFEVASVKPNTDDGRMISIPLRSGDRVLMHNESGWKHEFCTRITFLITK